MSPLLRSQPWLWVLASLLCLLGAGLLVQAEMQRQRDAFDTNARIVHRLLSQRVVQHDAVLATLSLLQPRNDQDKAEERLPSAFPQFLQAQHRSSEQAWPRTSLSAAEARSRAENRPALGNVDLALGRYELVTAAGSGGYALLIDLRQLVPWEEWPMDPATSPVQIRLMLGDQPFTVQHGRTDVPWPSWTLGFNKRLASASQDFDVQAQLSLGWSALPWWRMGAWAALVWTAAWGWQAWRRQNTERKRAEELLRLGQVARLNTLGELAAGVAHELNQPLTAVLANTQAAQRLLAGVPLDASDLQTARKAMGQAAGQARRAAEVVGRLRRVIERPDTHAESVPVSLAEVARSALHLLAPECDRRRIRLALDEDGASKVMAEPIALEQIVHNLLTNALQALEQRPVEARQIWLRIGQEQQEGLLQVIDNGPGIAPEALSKIFQPFFSTRETGLGLGLSLCETLAVGMGGSLSVRNATPQGAEFTLRLPLAPAMP